ncbi:hypothetical protein B0H17DRAFT_1211698 [Mycena rosella]|uniref:CCHC-type domain-containing protein n=1 Tax=Mycena rosella TaxID=1033263 RepID=A0AAD7CTW7_MYCRO|nr:hypothetical protein B0H17DRAFT_1211698 [Mycena rosella]
MAEMEARITELQQMPSRALANSFAGMATSSPTHNAPVRRNLTATFAAAADTTTAQPHAYRPDADRLRMITAAPMLIHPRTPASIASYNEQVAAYTRKHGSRQPTEDHPYPLTPGTVAVGSRECHKCGHIGHFGGDCTGTSDLHIPDVEAKWRRIVQYIRTRTVRAVPVNIVADASPEISHNVFGTAEYDAQVIEEYLLGQGKGSGSSA